jgi:hypothetical protein
MTRIVYLGLAGVAALSAVPAYASVAVTPAPVAGIGIGAIAVIGLGYRALKKRLHR